MFIKWAGVISIALVIILKGGIPLAMQPEEVPECYRYKLICQEDKRTYKEILKCSGTSPCYKNGECQAIKGHTEYIPCKGIMEILR